MAVAGDEGAAVPVDVGERPEPVHLRLEDELGMIEGLRDAQKAHRGKGGRAWTTEHTSARPVGLAEPV